MFKSIIAKPGFKFFILFFFWSLWISFEFLIGGYSHVRISDAGDSTLPQLIATKVQFLKYGLNYFAAYMASGVDGASQFMVPFLDLNTTVFILLPGWLAYGLIMFSQRLMASYFTFLLCRDTFKFSTMSSIAAGLSFSLFNYSIDSFTLYHQLGIVSLPFVLWSMDKIRIKRGLKPYFLTILLGLGVGFSNYFPIFTPYVLPFIFFWLVLMGKLKLKDIIIYSLFVVSLIAIQIPGVLALFSNMGLSHRITVDKSLFEQNFPDFTISWLGSLFRYYILPIAIITVLIFLKRSRLLIKPLLLLVFTLGIVILLKLFIPVLPIKFIKSFTYDRFEIFVPFVLSILLAASLHVFTRRKNILSEIFTFSFITLLIFGASLVVKFRTVLHYAPYRSLYSHPDLRDLNNKVDSRMWRVATITGGGIRPSYSVAYGLNAADGYLTLYPKTYQNLWSRVVEKRIQDDPMRFDDVNKWGNKLYLFGPKEYQSLARIDINSYYDMDLLSQMNVKYLIAMKPLQQGALELQGSSYREKMQNWNAYSLFKKLSIFLTGQYYGPPLYIYENKNAFPRFYFEDGSQVELVSYRPDKIILQGNNGQVSKLVVLFNYYPGWEADVNGQLLKPQRYKETFFAVDVPKGRNRITLSYKPNYFAKP